MDKDIVAEARDAFKESEEAERDNRKNALDDLRFARLGEQWPEEAIKLRGKERPCLTINKMPAFLRQVINETRQNKPSIKVHPVDSGADVETAKRIDGLIRNIEYTSNADVAYDTGADFAASMGFGYWRVGLDYACDDSFDMDLRIERVSNPFTVYGDPYSTAADSSDWNTCHVTDILSEEQFTAKYPEAEKIDWETDGRDEDSLGWLEDGKVRIAEYWKRTKVAKKLLKLSNGNIVYEEFYLTPDPNTGLSMQQIDAAQGVQVIGERITEGHKVTQCIVNAKEVLEENDWQGRYIPVIPVYGEEVNVEGKRHFLSLIRQAKDAQRMFNYWRTTTTELVALAPKAPWIGEQGAFDVDDRWTTANTENHPYLEHKKGTAAPQRQPFAGIPAGALQEAMSAADDMKSIMGLYDASLGARSNETSGKAIMARQREGDVSTFHFVDNVTRAIRHTGRILIDMIPHVYSQERVIRVLGEDGTPTNVKITDGQSNPMAGIYNLSTGKYDLTVQSGPNYTTRRQEAADQMMQLIQSFPQAAPVIGDLLVKNLDWPGADEIAERMKAMQQAQSAPPDPSKDPKVMVAMAGVEAKKQEAMLNEQYKRAELDLKREELQLKKDEALFNAKMKQEEHQSDMMMMAEKHRISMDQVNQKAMQEMHGKMLDATGGQDGVAHPLVSLLEAVVVSNQQTAQSVQQLAQALVVAETSPKTVTMMTSQGKQLTATVNKAQ